MFDRISGARQVMLPGLLLALALLAAPGTADAAPRPATEGLCATCHAIPGLQMQMEGGGTVSVYVDPRSYAASVHGLALRCTACHPNLQSYPHVTGELAPSRDRNAAELVRSYTVCGQCHEEQLAEFLGSYHARELAAGNADSAGCADCHGSHDIQPADPKEVGLALQPSVHACGECHQEQYDEYGTSAHGLALLQEDDTHVPACVDCHGSHGMGQATTAAFRARSPYLCASCHADEALMANYGLSPHVLKTYVADFHGTTAQLFPHSISQPSAPSAAVCYDCHGAHNITYTAHPNSPVSRARLVQVCQECHEDASDKFPAAWLGHYEATPQRNAPVFWTSRFFLVLTIGVIGMMIGHISLDVLRATLDKLLGGKHSDD
jgi:predicted CXXCH cytochrome family protein